MNGYVGLSFNIADRLNAGRLKLSFKPNTILSWVGEKVYAPIVGAEGKNTVELIESIESYKAELHAQRLMSSFEDAEVVLVEDPVQISIESVASDMEQIALGIINKTKNAFIPLVNDVYEKTFTQTRDRIDVGGIKLDVVTDGSETGFWENPIVNMLVEKNEDIVDPIPWVEKATATPLIPEDQEALIQSIPAELVQLVTKVVPDVTLAELMTQSYRCLFSDEACNEKVPESIEVILNIFTLDFIADNTPQGITYQGSIADFRLNINKARGWYLNRLATLAQGVERQSSLGRLVVRYPAPNNAFSGGAKIVVDGRALDSWVEQGGSLDLIYGAYVSDFEKDGAKLLESRERYERAWHRFVATAQQKQAHLFESTFCSALHQNLVKVATEFKLKIDPKGIDQIYDRISAITEDNAYHFTRKAVAHCFFKDEDYLTICDHIDQVSCAVPGIELEDAIPLAITDWMVAWALSQVTIGKED